MNQRSVLLFAGSVCAAVVLYDIRFLCDLKVSM